MPLHLPSEGAALPRRSLEKALWSDSLTSEKETAAAVVSSTTAFCLSRRCARCR